MDLLLLLAQIVLVVLVVVVPLMSGYDKWREWSPARRMMAVALGTAIGVVAFSQYRRVVMLKARSLPDALSFEGRGAWYTRRIWMSPWEYGLTLLATGVLLALALTAAQKKQWPQAAGYTGLVLVTVFLSVSVKLNLWR